VVADDLDGAAVVAALRSLAVEDVGVPRAAPP
jgi:hypothetical protein